MKKYEELGENELLELGKQIINDHYGLDTEGRKKTSCSRDIFCGILLKLGTSLRVGLMIRLACRHGKIALARG